MECRWFLWKEENYVLGASTYVVNETVVNNITEQDKKILETITVLL